MENINHRCDYDYDMVEENKAWLKGQLESILEEFKVTKQTQQMLKEKRVEQISFTINQVRITVTPVHFILSSRASCTVHI